MPAIDPGLLPCQPVWHGNPPLHGLWFPADWYDDAQRAARLVAAWQPGATAWRFAAGDALRFALPLPADAAQLGWPLVRVGQTLSSAGISPGEAARLPEADLWIVDGGRVLALHFAGAEPLEPAGWLSVDDHVLLDTDDFRDEPGEAVLATPAVPGDVREVLGEAVAPADAAQQRFVQAIGQPPQSRPDTRNGTTGSAAWKWQVALTIMLMGWLLITDRLPPLSSPGWLIPITVWAVHHWIARRLAGGAQPLAARLVDSLPARRLRARLPQRWQDWVARMVMTTPLARAFGHRQAAYLRRMLEMFENGRLDEALRHAIPLGGGDGSDSPSLSTPHARKDLRLGAPGTSGRASLNLDPPLRQYLMDLYRRSFGKLDREGRIDEAVFVLAELLQSHAEALDYLEKQQRFTQAAALALYWDMAADTIVRLHCLAGDWKHAVAVARRDNAFSTAILQLEDKWPDAARRLREEWAATLAAQGAWLEAVDAAWPLPDFRPQAAQWLQNVEQAGGQLQARALLRRAILLPDTMVHYHDFLLGLRDDPEQYPARAAIADSALTLGARGPGVAAILRPLLPGLLADRMAGHGKLDRRTLSKLVTLAADPVFAADLPDLRFPPPAVLPLNQQQTPLDWQAPAAGARALQDAVPLNDDTFLLALGEAGAMLVDRHGTPLHRFPQPAERLVPAHNGQVVLALAQRGTRWRVSRLDLLNRTATDLGSGEFDHMAEQFDGIGWTVVSGSRLQVLDVTTSLQSVLWQVADLPGMVTAFCAGTSVEQLLIQTGPDEVQLWCYHLPERRLSSRWPQEKHTGDGLLLERDEGCVVFHTEQDRDGQIVLHRGGRGDDGAAVTLPGPAGHGSGLMLKTGAGWYLACRTSPNGAVDLFHVGMRDWALKAALHWPAGSGLQVRVADDWWQVIDQHGRLFHVDVSLGRTLSLSVF